MNKYYYTITGQEARRSGKVGGCIKALNVIIENNQRIDFYLKKSSPAKADVIVGELEELLCPAILPTG
jgi:hypothetical protein